jgi:hypothetical protein
MKPFLDAHDKSIFSKRFLVSEGDTASTSYLQIARSAGGRCRMYPKPQQPPTTPCLYLASPVPSLLAWELPCSCLWLQLGIGDLGR